MNWNNSNGNVILYMILFFSLFFLNVLKMSKNNCTMQTFMIGLFKTISIPIPIVIFFNGCNKDLELSA